LTADVLVVGAGLAGLACAQELVRQGVEVQVLEGGPYVAGDHRDTSSIQGALVSGRRAARAVVRDLAGG
jgi:monoamine oxidase